MANGKSFIEGIELQLDRAILFQFINVFIIIAVLIALLVTILRWFVVRPFKKVSEISYKMASFDLTCDIDVYESKDEIGNMFNALNTMLFEYRKIVSEVKESGKKMAGASQMMQNIITSIASSIDQISTNIFNISNLTEKMSANSTIIADTIQKLSSSIEHIGNNAKIGSDIAKNAVLLSKNAEETMTILGKSAFQIGDVTDVIKRIADKTTLLALNADIEAASVGDAGKGFGVVANEIKEFAHQSTRAAENIDLKINSMQKETKKTVSVIIQTIEIINSIDASSENIALSLVEQRKAVEDMTSSVQYAHLDAQEIAGAMTQLSEGANEIAIRTGIAAGSLESQEDSFLDKGIVTSASQVSQLANDLLNLVEKFKTTETK